MNENNVHTILLVEDEKLIALGTAKTLEGFGYKVVIASSGEEAIECVASIPELNIVLMDIDLGSGLDGTEAAVEILKSKNIPIIFLTSHSEESFVNKVRGITRYGYVVKNSGDFVLKCSIEMGLELFQSHRLIKENEELLSLTFQSIGDAVVATDCKGLVVRMNPKAEELTGWRIEEAIGLHFHDIFKIYNASTRQIVDNPLDKVLETGNVVGLANHTVLVGKNGKEFQISDTAAPIRDINNQLHGVIIVFSDVTEKYLQEEEIRKSEEKFRKLITNLTSGLVVHNPDTTISYANQMASELLGLSFEQMQGKKAIHPDWAFINEDGSKMDEKDFPVNIIFKENKVLKNHLVGFRKPNQDDPTWVLCNAFPVWENNVLKEGVVTFHEVTERIVLEHSMRESNKNLDHLLAEKGLLIKEIHHRVKNNLVLITSLLSLQAEEFSDEKLKNALKDSESRVRGMVNLYNQLFISDDRSIVSVKLYLEDMLLTIQDIYYFVDIEFEHDIEEIQMDPKTILNLGIIVNEVLTNSIKYAFPNNQKGLIKISLKKVDSFIQLDISDNGIGFCPDIDHNKGFGLRLIDMLTTQLQGKSEFFLDNGTHFILNFLHG